MSVHPSHVLLSCMMSRPRTNFWFYIMLTALEKLWSCWGKFPCYHVCLGRERTVWLIPLCYTPLCSMALWQVLLISRTQFPCGPETSLNGSMPRSLCIHVTQLWNMRAVYPGFMQFPLYLIWTGQQEYIGANEAAVPIRPGTGRVAVLHWVYHPLNCNLDKFTWDLWCFLTSVWRRSAWVAGEWGEVCSGVHQQSQHEGGERIRRQTVWTGAAHVWSEAHRSGAVRYGSGMHFRPSPISLQSPFMPVILSGPIPKSLMNIHRPTSST